MSFWGKSCKSQSLGAFDFSYSPLYIAPNYKCLGIPRVTTENWAKLLNPGSSQLTSPNYPFSNQTLSTPLLNRVCNSAPRHRRYNMEKQWKETASPVMKCGSQEPSKCTSRKERRNIKISRILLQLRKIKEKLNQNFSSLGKHSTGAHGLRFKWRRLLTWLTFVNYDAHDFSSFSNKSPTQT